MAANDDTTTWETDQVTLWIDNDEGLYREAPRYKNAADLADAFEPLLPAFGVDDVTAVDWQAVYDHVHEDDENEGDD